MVPVTGQVHLYHTPTRWLTPEIDQLLRQLIDHSPNEIKILTSNRELKQSLIGRYTSTDLLQTFPIISTLDEWVIGASGISIRRSPLMEALAKEIAIQRIKEYAPDIAALMPLHGIWRRMKMLAELRVMEPIPIDAMNAIATQWFPNMEKPSLPQILDDITTARDDAGIRDQLFAYRYGNRENWLPITAALEQSTLILVGFSEPTTTEQSALIAMIRASALSIIPIPTTPYPPETTKEWITSLREFSSIQEIELPNSPPSIPITIWQPNSTEDELNLIVKLASDAPYLDIGIALADFDALKYPISTALANAGITSSIVNPIALRDTQPGMLLAATINAIHSQFKLQSVFRWMEVRLSDCPHPELTGNDIIACRNRLLGLGFLDTDRWPPQAPNGEVSTIWTLASQLTAQTLDTVSSWMQSLGHPNSPNWSLTATKQWGTAFQLLAEWDTLRPLLDPSHHGALLLEGLSQTSIPESNAHGIRICSLHHASVVPVDRWIIPRAINQSWPPIDPWGTLLLPSKSRIPSLDDRIQNHQRWLEWAIGHARVDIHIIAPHQIDTEPQLVSGILVATLSAAQLPTTYATPTPTPPSQLSARLHSQPPITPSIPHTFSASQFESYQKCPRHYLWSRLLKADSTSSRHMDLDPDEQGQLLHIIAGQCLLFLQNQPLTSDALIHAGIQWLETVALRQTQAIRGGNVGKLIHRRLVGTMERPGILRLALPQMSTFLQEFKVIDIERAFHFEIPGTSIAIKGRIDMVAQHRPSGKTIIIDFKTGSTPITKIHLETLEHLQLPIYRLALQQEGISVEAGQIWVLSRQKIERKTVMVTELGRNAFVAKRQQPHLLTPQYDHLVIEHIQWVVGQIEAHNFAVTGIPEISRQENARPDTLCRHCQFILSCPFEHRYG